MDDVAGSWKSMGVGGHGRVVLAGKFVVHV
jgi:hypothetical protein